MADRRRAGDHGQVDSQCRHHDRVGRGVGEYHAGDHGWRADRRAPITVKADSQARHHDRVGRGVGERGAGLGGVSLAGGGNARNLIGSSATALVNGSRIDGNAGNALNIDADMSGTIKATVVVASVGFTAAGASLIGSAGREQHHGNGRRAPDDSNKLSNLGAVSVTADMRG